MQTTVLRQQVFRPASGRAPARRATPSITCAAAPEQQQREVPGLKQLAVGLAAAVLVHSAPANAGVVIQKSQLKKVFQSDPVEQVKKAGQEAVQKAPGNDGGAPSLPKVNLPSGGGLNASLLTLPLAIGGIAVGALGWKQIDPGFDNFFDTALAKNSNKDGAGYEQLVKSGANMLGGSKKTTKGTKKVGSRFFGKKK
jgi:hypothetical protein